MTAPAAFKATFYDFRLVKGRKVAQIVVEVPIEEADNALKALGGIPRPDIDRWVAVARISPGASIVEPALAQGNAGDARLPPPPRVAPGETKPQRTLAQFVGMRCNDKRFQRWIADQECTEAEQVDEAFAATWVREKCDVHTRADIKTGSLAEVAWKRIETQFLEATGQMAEAR